LRPECDVDVWLISLENDGEIVLSEDEEVRAARFHFDVDRIRWIRAHSALRLILAKFLGVGALDLRFSVGPHGKPSLIEGGGLEFNLSHAGSWAAVAVARNVPVGVDIERMREKVDMAALLRRLGETSIPETSEELYRAWTRREATSKAAGGALFDRWDHDFGVRELVVPEGYCGSVALIGYEPYIRQHDDFGTVST
jgi:4'-phosphopantetheinyl transferase